MLLNEPIPSEWGSYVTQSPVGLEIVPFMLYDTETYVGSVSLNLEFFKSVQGKNLSETNMKQGGSLSNPEAMLIQSIRILYKNTTQSDDDGQADFASIPSQFNDVVQLSTTGIGQLKIGNKEYGPWPLWTLPAQSFVKGAFATGGDILNDYGQVDGMLYALLPNLMISPLQPFIFTLSWPSGAVILSQDVYTDGVLVTSEELPIEVLFDGQLARAIQ